MTDNDIERREIVDDKGQLVAVGIFRNGAVRASWSADLDRVLSKHPAVLAEVERRKLLNLSQSS